MSLSSASAYTRSHFESFSLYPNIVSGNQVDGAPGVIKYRNRVRELTRALGTLQDRLVYSLDHEKSGLRRDIIIKRARLTEANKALSKAHRDANGEQAEIIETSFSAEEFHGGATHDQKSHGKGWMSGRPIPPPPPRRAAVARPAGTLPDIPFSQVKIAYRPRHPDGKADPGEVVWAKIPFEENPSMSKDRPVLIIGRSADGKNLVGVQLTSKDKTGRTPIGKGDWDKQGRDSYLNTDRFVQINDKNYRREGSFMRKPVFQGIVDTLTKQQGASNVELSVEAFHAKHNQKSHGRGSGGGSVDARIESIKNSLVGNKLSRSQMPQIPKAKAAAFDKYLTERGINSKNETVKASSLKGTQNEINGDAVKSVMKAVREGKLPNKRIPVSSDNQVVDGHHRWAAAKVAGKSIQVRRLNAPIGKILEVANKFNDATGIKRKGINDFAAEEFHAKHNQKSHGRKGGGKFQEITAAEGARGDSRAVSSAEFQKLAQDGQKKLDGMKARSAPIDGLDKNWDSLKESSYAEATKSWGGATINARTGEVLPQGADAYALTVKDKGFDTVSVPEGASQSEFNTAMDAAKEKFRPILEREDHHLGVFHDDDLGRIDFDPVVVTTKLSDVHTIGAATRAIGGAYRFSDGNGYWPPHVADS